MPVADNLWKKSLYFELVNRRSGRPEDAMTLIIPPENYKIQETQRTMRTKTFGGVFEDDYGPDNPMITISGSSGNSTDIRTVFRGALGSQQYTGPEAILEFRNRIMRYKNRIENFEEYELRVFDLSAVDERLLQTRGGTVAIRRADSFAVSIDDFSTSRDKEKPFFINYTIQLFVLRIIGDSYVRSPVTTGRISVSNVQRFVQNVRRGLLKVRESITSVQSVVNQINTALATIASLEDQVNEYVLAATSIVSTTIDSYYRLFDIARFPASVARFTLDNVKSAMDAVDNAIESTPALLEGIGDDYGSLKKVMKEVKSSAAALVKFGKSADSERGITVALTSSPASSDPSTLEATLDSLTPEDPTAQGRFDTYQEARGETARIESVTAIRVTQSTNYEELAASIYGDPSKANLLLLFNGLANEDLQVGDVVRVPLTVNSPRIEDNAVFTEDKTDVLGTDIDMTGGDLAVGSSGDYLTVTDLENLVQALNNRLSEELGSRVRLTQYGISTAVGFPINSSASISYLMANVADTVLQDPRVSDVSNLALTVSDDRVLVTMDIRTINYEVIPFSKGL